MHYSLSFTLGIVYVNRLWVSEVTNKMILRETPDSFNNNERRDDIDRELYTHDVGALLSGDM